MNWSDVRFNNRIVRLDDTKNGTKRNLPFWGEIEPAVTKQKAYRDAHHPDYKSLFFWMAEDTDIVGHRGVVAGDPILDFRESWDKAIEDAHRISEAVQEGLLFHDLRRSAIRIMVQDAGIPQAQAKLISGHLTDATFNRYNIVSLKNLDDAGVKLDAWKAQQPVVKVLGSRQSRRKTSA